MSTGGERTVKSGHFWPYLLALLAGYSLLLVTGCGVAPTQTMSPIPTPTSVNAPTPAQPEASVTPEPTQVDEETMDDSPIPEATSLIEQARQDLKSRLQIEDSRISLGSVEAVQWRDSSLGCPQPGRSYLTVITPGYLIVLEADGQPYEYHASENQVVYCDDSVPPYAGEEKPENTLIEAAKTDLSLAIDHQCRPNRSAGRRIQTVARCQSGLSPTGHDVCPGYHPGLPDYPLRRRPGIRLPHRPSASHSLRALALRLGTTTEPR